MFIVGILAWIAIGAALKGAYEHTRSERARSADKRLKAAAKAAPGGKLPKAQQRKALRRHAAGWWAGEVFHGFPVTRTGLHAGYLAHRTAADHQRHVREEARTTALETRASFAPSWKEHRKRQAAAQAEILEHLGEAPEGQRTGKEAVQRAADEVAAKRAERQQRPPAAPTVATNPAQPTDYWADVEGNGRRTPIIWQTDSDGREYTEIPPGVGWDSIAETARQHGAIDRATGHLIRGAVIDPTTGQIVQGSSHLRPGEPPCEACGGSGRNAAGDDACPACRGFGSAPASPLSPLAPSGAICGACGHGEKRGDPVLAAQGGYNIHLSHAKEQQEAYWHALNLMRARADAKEAEADFAKASMAGDEAGVDAAIERHEEACRRITAAGGDLDAGSSGPDLGEPGPDASRSPQPVEGEIDDAVIAADHDFEGEFDTHRDCPRCGAKAGHACALGCDAPPSELEQNPTASPTTTEGAPSVSETNVKSVTAAAVGFTAQTEGDAVAYAQRRQQAEQHLEDMQAAGVDSETLSDQMDLVDRLRHAEEAVKAVPEQATVVSTGLQKRHGGIDQAVDDSPIDRAAQPTFYGQG